MTDILERRYERLLRWYPKTHRDRYRDELLDTLLESARPGQRRPTRREATALVLAGLRARAHSDQPRGPRENWAQGLQILVVVMLVGIAVDVATVPYVWGRSYGLPMTWVQQVSAVPALLAALCLLRGRLVTAAALVVVAAVTDHVAYGMIVLPFPDATVTYLWVLMGALLLATVLRPRSPRRSPAWLAPAVLLGGIQVLGDSLSTFGPPGWKPIAIALLVIPLIGVPVFAVAWNVVDPRPATAASWWSLFMLLDLGTVVVTSGVGADLHSRVFVAALGMLGLLLLTALSSVFGIRRMIRV